MRINLTGNIAKARRYYGYVKTRLAELKRLKDNLGVKFKSKALKFPDATILMKSTPQGEVAFIEGVSGDLVMTFSYDVLDTFLNVGMLSGFLESTCILNKKTPTVNPNEYFNSNVGVESLIIENPPGNEAKKLDENIFHDIVERLYDRGHGEALSSFINNVLIDHNIAQYNNLFDLNLDYISFIKKATRPKDGKQITDFYIIAAEHDDNITEPGQIIHGFWLKDLDIDNPTNLNSTIITNLPPGIVEDHGEPYIYDIVVGPIFKDYNFSDNGAIRLYSEIWRVFDLDGSNNLISDTIKTYNWQDNYFNSTGQQQTLIHDQHSRATSLTTSSGPKNVGINRNHQNRYDLTVVTYINVENILVAVDQSVWNSDTFRMDNDRSVDSQVGIDGSQYIISSSALEINASNAEDYEADKDWNPGDFPERTDLTPPNPYVSVPDVDHVSFTEYNQFGIKFENGRRLDGKDGDWVFNDISAVELWSNFFNDTPLPPNVELNLSTGTGYNTITNQVNVGGNFGPSGVVTYVPTGGDDGDESGDWLFSYNGFDLTNEISYSDNTLLTSFISDPRTPQSSTQAWNQETEISRNIPPAIEDMCSFYVIPNNLSDPIGYCLIELIVDEVTYGNLINNYEASIGTPDEEQERSNLLSSGIVHINNCFDNVVVAFLNIRKRTTILMFEGILV